MPSDITQAERRDFRRSMGRSVRDVVREAAGIEDPAELEQLGFELCESLALAPTGIPDELMAMIAAERDGLSLLRGIAAAASPPVSRLAAAYAAGLEGASASPAADRVAPLAPERAFRLEADEPISSLVVAARRPGASGVQILGFTQEWPETGGAIKDGFASGTEGADELDRILQETADLFGVNPIEIGPAEAVARIAAGARRGAECRLGPTSDALLAVNLLVRAGERDAEEVLAALPGLPALADVIPSWDEDDDENEAVDEDALEAEVEELLAALDAWCEDRNAAADWQSLVTFAGGSMAEFRLSYCATGPADWNAGDLHEYLLDYVPRKVTIAEEDIERFPLGVAEVLHFLGETGRLDAHEASDLAGRAA